MSYVSKSVAISPPEADSAGCSASCPGEQTDYSDGWSREYTLSASLASGWRFVKFTWSKVRRTASGTTPIGDYESVSNPSTAADGLAEARIYGDTTYWQENLIENIVAHFEPDAPTTTYTASASANPSGWGTVKVGSAAAGSTSTLTNITAGSTVTVVATPETGYRFVSWSDGGAQTHDVTVNSDINLTATFETDTPPVGIVTIVISAHNGWGEVSFNGESWTSGAWSKTVHEGSSVTVMARQTYQYGPVFRYWGSSIATSSESTFTFTATASTTVTAYFGYFVRYSASKVSDPTISAPVGQVRILADGIVSHWTDNSYQYVLDSNTITVEQRSLPVGWQFVKWYYKREYDANWFEITSETLTLGVDRWYIYAAFNCTDLLVNSSTVENPAKLVYDPATNKLVADY